MSWISAPLFALVSSQGLIAFPPVAEEEAPKPPEPLKIDFAEDGLRPEHLFELEYASTPALRPGRDELSYLRVRADRRRDRYARELWWVTDDAHLPMVTGRAGLSDPAWSPSGDRIAFLAKHEGRPQLHVHWPEPGRTAILTRVAEGVSSFAWSPDGTRLAFTSAVPAPSTPVVVLPKAPEEADWAPSALFVDRAVYRRDGQGFIEKSSLHVFALSADGGAAVQLTRGAHHREKQLAWLGDAVVFAANRSEAPDLNPLALDLYAVDVQDRTLRRLTDAEGPERGPVASKDGRSLAFLGHGDEGKGWHRDRLFVLDVASRRVEPWLDDLDFSVADVRADERGWLVAWAEEGRGRVGLAQAPDRLKPLADDVEVGGGGRPYVGFGLDSAFGGTSRDLVLTRRSADRPSELHRLRRGRLERVVALNPKLARLKLGELQRGKTSSGVTYWRILPPKVDAETARRLPMLLEIHGGPYASYGGVFSAELQLYASAGFMVVYANPRGSTSYGTAWADAIEKNYPGPDVEDLLAVVDGEVAAGRADPDRLCVTGGSGGGVLSAWLVGITDRFRAAVVAKPVINWTSFVLTADESPFFTRYWFRKPPWEDHEAYWRRSPLSQVGEVETPTMLLTGEADLRTPISESEQFYQALRQRGVPTALVRLPGASHGISRRPSHLASKVGHVLYWLKTHGEGQRRRIKRE